MADATEAAADLAAEHGIDLESLVGSGADGKILVSDVEAAVNPEPPVRESEQDGPQDWPQGEDYDPREDPGPTRPEDE